jgi:hypothetical protein
MPTYDYVCAANGRVVEVHHRMSEELATWGDLCARAGIEPGSTPVNSPVSRLATGGNFISGTSKGESALPACTTGSCCPGGMCGLS